MDKKTEQRVDTVKQLADKKEELRQKTGVCEIAAVARPGVKGQLDTVSALLDAKGTELNDLMQRPRVTAAESSRLTWENRAERAMVQPRGRLTFRMRKEIPKPCPPPQT